MACGVFLIVLAVALQLTTQHTALDAQVHATVASPLPTEDPCDVCHDDIQHEIAAQRARLAMIEQHAPPSSFSAERAEAVALTLAHIETELAENPTFTPVQALAQLRSVGLSLDAIELSVVMTAESTSDDNLSLASTVVTAASNVSGAFTLVDTMPVLPWSQLLLVALSGVLIVSLCVVYAQLRYGPPNPAFHMTLRIMSERLRSACRTNLSFFVARPCCIDSF